MKIEPIILRGDKLTLEPLKKSQIGKLAKFCFDERIWQWYPFTINNLGDLTRYVDDAFNNQNNGSELPFVMIQNSTSTVVGSSRFMNIDAGNFRVEIGSTWIDPLWQRTFVNSEAKLLMLSHAFEIWKCIRVEFKTDSLNLKSRNAILGLGAKEEGIHRQHMKTRSGRLRDSVFYSIIDSEWPAVKRGLIAKLNSYS